MLNKNLNALHSFQASHLHPTIKNFRPVLDDSGFIAETGFLDVLQLKIDATVMLIHNLDTADSLTNGCMGIIKGFKKNSAQSIEYILVHFDHPLIGEDYRKTHDNILSAQEKEFTPIPRVTFQYSLGKATKSHTFTAKLIQFPIQLAFAITAHKIQGQTVTKPSGLVADLSSVFTAGQAYVILSRVQCLQQLYLLSFPDNKIKTDPKAKQETEEMTLRSLNIQPNLWLAQNSDHFKISCLNIRSLAKHQKDLENDQLILHSDIICLTETQLPLTHSIDFPNYNSFTCSFGKGKGSAILIKANLPPPKHISILQNENYQCIAITLETINIACIYRSTRSFQNLSIITAFLTNNFDFSKPTYITGDFNIQYNKYPKNHLSDTLFQKGLIQIVQFPTHDKGNILDHFYTQTENITMHFLHSVYYSDHDAVCCLVNK
jgi:hypothetical protein